MLAHKSHILAMQSDWPIDRTVMIILIAIRT